MPRFTRISPESRGLAKVNHNSGLAHVGEVAIFLLRIDMENAILFLFYATILSALAVIGCVIVEAIEFWQIKRAMKKALDNHADYITRLNTGWKL